MSIHGVVHDSSVARPYFSVSPVRDSVDTIRSNTETTNGILVTTERESCYKRVTGLIF